MKKIFNCILECLSWELGTHLNFEQGNRAVYSSPPFLCTFPHLAMDKIKAPDT